MKIEEEIDFIRWVSPALAAISLALFLFAPSLSGADEAKRNWSIHLFLLSIPFLMFATLLVHEIPTAVITNRKTMAAFFIFLLVGIVALMVGFCLLVWAIDSGLLTTLAIAFVPSSVLYWVARQVDETTP